MHSRRAGAVIDLSAAGDALRGDAGAGLHAGLHPAPPQGRRKEGTSLFADDALKRIAEWAQGIPRRINQICTAALIAGAVAKAKVIDDTPVRQAINDLERE
jgi:hypothetical protein